MRRRSIIQKNKEREDGLEQELQRRTGLVRSERSRQYREREVLGASRKGDPDDRRRHFDERVGEQSRGHEFRGEEQVEVEQVVGEELGTVRGKLTGVCRICGDYVGRGVYLHEKACGA